MAMATTHVVPAELEHLSYDEPNERTLAHLQSFIGEKLREEGGVKNTEACRDNILSYARGVRDLNPLWVDPDYGRDSMFGTNLAPPLFLQTVSGGGITPGCPHLMGLFAGSTWRFYDRVRLGDHGLRADLELIEAELRTNSRGITRIYQIGRVTYFRAGLNGEERVAECDQAFFRQKRVGATNYEPRDPSVWSEEQLEEIGREVLSERVRGAEPRYWEDVNVGEELWGFVRGPLTAADQAAYTAGNRGGGRVAYDGWWLHLDEPPEQRPNNVPGPLDKGQWRSGTGHQDAADARRSGMPGAYDGGPMRIAVGVVMVTNWMGDAGYVREFEMTARRPVIEGDVLRFSGRVEELLDESVAQRPGEGPAKGVRISLEVRNQFDEAAALGSTLVELPTRSNG
jgi:acyl dehydratase